MMAAKSKGQGQRARARAKGKEQRAKSKELRAYPLLARMIGPLDMTFKLRRIEINWPQISGSVALRLILEMR
jgi:hypothetical protein